MMTGNFDNKNMNDAVLKDDAFNRVIDGDSLKSTIANPHNAVLSAQNIAIGYKKGDKIIKTVHKNLSFNLFAGELICLLGPNGAGKSTLLKTLGNFIPSIGGEIFLYGKTLTFILRKICQN
jgi:ABC-type cobalamin/Fe3+-siderophores transport systems, ATPase components